MHNTHVYWYWVVLFDVISRTDPDLAEEIAVHAYNEFDVAVREMHKEAA